MLQSAFCPDGCAPGQCQQDSTIGALRCAQCLNNLLVATVDGIAGLCSECCGFDTMWSRPAMNLQLGHRLSTQHARNITVHQHDGVAHGD
jgi:hypothetical protein